ncbi:MAG TPA: hypothetical protein VFV99_20760 [Kofleriaceae bacterium]|nr:hypothetical protein [Kofleriaceae bacterium]
MTFREAVPVSLCVLAAACVKVPEFQPHDGAVGDGSDADASIGGPLVHIEPAGLGAIVTAPRYEMRFSQDGSLFPYQLNVGANRENMVLGGSEHCADESGIGVALYPAWRANGLDQAGMGTPSLEIAADGPYVGQIRLSWSQSLSCGAGAGSLTGHTVYSFFPDGRLARYDDVDNGPARDASDCSICTPNGQASSTFFLTSYTTLIADNNATSTDGNLATLDTYGEELMPGPGLSTCIAQRGTSIAFSWINAPTRVRVAAAPPTSQARTLAFVKDMFTGGTLGASAGWATTTQMGISSEACGVLENRIAEFSVDDHQLLINGNSLGAAQVDGIYGGYPQVSGYPVDFPVTLQPSGAQPRIPAGFAVWLYSQPIPQTMTLTHSGGHTGNWYYEQRVDQNSVVFWFNVSLEQGQTITITDS